MCPIESNVNLPLQFLFIFTIWQTPCGQSPQNSPVAPHASILPPRHLARATQAQARKHLHIHATGRSTFGRPVEAESALTLIVDAVELLQRSRAAGSVLDSVVVATGEIGGFEKTHVNRGWEWSWVSIGKRRVKGKPINSDKGTTVWMTDREGVTLN